MNSIKEVQSYVHATDTEQWKLFTGFELFTLLNRQGHVFTVQRIRLGLDFKGYQFGLANEDPFENKVTDVALSAICNTIERNLREMLGEMELPEKIEPVDGYLF